MAAFCGVVHTYQSSPRSVFHWLGRKACGSFLFFFLLQSSNTESILSDQILQLLQWRGLVLGDIVVAVVRRHATCNATTL